MIDPKTKCMIIGVSRKFRPVCANNRQYFIPYFEDDDAKYKSTENKWSEKKFKDVGKLMAFLIYDAKTHKNPAEQTLLKTHGLEPNANLRLGFKHSITREYFESELPNCP